MFTKTLLIKKIVAVHAILIYDFGFTIYDLRLTTSCPNGY